MSHESAREIVRRLRSWPRCALAVAVIVLSLSTVGPAPVALGQTDVTASANALRGFDSGIGRYRALRHRLERRLPSESVGRDGFSTLIARLYLASAIRHARATACEGNIIDASAAQVFRSRIASVLASPAAATPADRPRRDADEAAPQPVVNEPYPVDLLEKVPAGILLVLPPLEDDLVYRVVNDDLILWDVHAEIVVDVLPDALVGPGR